MAFVKSSQGVSKGGPRRTSDIRIAMPFVSHWAKIAKRRTCLEIWLNILSLEDCAMVLEFRHPNNRNVCCDAFWDEVLAHHDCCVHRDTYVGISDAYVLVIA